MLKNEYMGLLAKIGGDTAENGTKADVRNNELPVLLTLSPEDVRLVGEVRSGRLNARVRGTAPEARVRVHGEELMPIFCSLLSNFWLLLIFGKL